MLKKQASLKFDFFRSSPHPGFVADALPSTHYERTLRFRGSQLDVAASAAVKVAASIDPRHCRASDQ
jgi:hypothetical protein